MLCLETYWQGTASYQQYPVYGIRRLLKVGGKKYDRAAAREAFVFFKTVQVTAGPKALNGYQQNATRTTTTLCYQGTIPVATVYVSKP